MSRDHAIRDILVPYVNADSERGPLHAALALAERFDARVAVLVTVDVPAPLPNDWGAMSYDLYARLHQDACDRAARLGETLRARFAGAASPVEVRTTESIALHPADSAAMHARHADLVVLPTAPDDVGDGLALGYFGDVLIHAGRPVLAAPAAATLAWPIERATIAWKPTAQSARAVHEALPLLRMAKAVDVLIVDPHTDEGAYGEEPGADIAAHLARHGLNVEVTTRPSMGVSAAHAIAQFAQRSGSALIVAGGYGHTRLREFVLGRATRDLMRTTTVPILFSH